MRFLLRKHGIGVQRFVERSLLRIDESCWFIGTEIKQRAFPSTDESCWLLVAGTEPITTDYCIRSKKMKLRGKEVQVQHGVRFLLRKNGIG